MTEKKTLEQKSDRVLQILKFRALYKLEGGEFQDGYTVDIILKSNFEDVTDGEVQYIADILIADGYIEKDESETESLYKITRSGQRFIDEVGYEKRKIDIENRRKIDELTIKSLNRAKLALWISLFAVIISALTLLLDKS
ncbi:MAG TPA: hypothetical protein DCG75_08025 [Bacteroidales bacterium]|nr:hypothetical protein [Bacteroidales bacterium]